MLASLRHEDNICDNIKNSFTRANKNKLFLDNIHNSTFNIPSHKHHSIFVWNNNSNIIFLNKKCNHLFLYNCNYVTIHNVDCLTGVTMLNCKHCHILFKKPPTYTIEVSNSFDIIFRSLFFQCPIIFRHCSIILYKDFNFIPLEYIKIDNHNIFSQWNYQLFNF